MIPKSGEKGFTLLELSIVLTIIALLIAGGLVLGTAQIEQSRIRETNAKLDTIEASLNAYVQAFNRLPCPADLTLAPSNAASGQEVTNATDCLDSGAGIFRFQSGAIDVFEGAVPARTLQLSDEFMLDGWGRRMNYTVDSGAATLAGPLPFEAGGEKENADAPGDISVDIVGGVCANAATLRADASLPAGGTPIGAVYVLFSHGKNGHGAWFKQGGNGRLDSDINNTSEYENSHFTSFNTEDGSFDNCFVQGEETVGNTALPSTTTFDDILRFKTRWQIELD